MISSQTFPITRIENGSPAETEDILAVEEPLEIRLEHNKRTHNISVTMRTPGNDTELAVGFLYTEGIIRHSGEIKDVAHAPGLFGPDDNIVVVTLTDDTRVDLSRLSRNFYTTSSCGVCGKASIDSIRVVASSETRDAEKIYISHDLIFSLPDLLRSQQDIFESTGGLHASAIFDTGGSLVLLREDVGRHNALDKLIGAALQKDWVPLNQHLLLLSGRASFELIQKAAMAGIQVIAAVGAPSTLAVDLAKEFDMTLIGFLRGQRFNIYSGKERVWDI